MGRLWIVVLVVAVVLALSLLAVPALMRRGGGFGRGSYLMYEFVCGGARHSYLDTYSGDLRHLAYRMGVGGDLPFYMLIYRSYGEAVRNFHGVWREGVEIGDARRGGCEILARELYLAIRVEGVDGDVVHVNMSLIFVHGLARCGPDYGDFPGMVVGGRWASVNSSRVSTFERLTITRSVDVRGSEVVGGGGEWVFWLGKRDLEADLTAVLYGIDEFSTVGFRLSPDVSEEPLAGGASLIILSRARTAPHDYSWMSINVPRDRQRYFYFWEDMREANLTALSGLGWKPWRYIPNSVLEKNGKVAGGAVEYDGRYYLEATSISEAAYSEGGVLLYASVRDVDLFYLLPYPVVKLFGIVIASTPYSTVTLKLSDTNMPLT